MTRTQAGNAGMPARPQSTWAERAIVLGGIALALLWTAAAPALGLDLETVAAAWLAALVWAAISSLTLALRRGFRDGDWSAFGRVEPFDNRDTIEWSTKSGSYTYLRIAEENERRMRRD